MELDQLLFACAVTALKEPLKFPSLKKEDLIFLQSRNKIHQTRRENNKHSESQKYPTSTRAFQRKKSIGRAAIVLSDMLLLHHGLVVQRDEVSRALA